VLTVVLTKREAHYELGQTRVYFKVGILEELEVLRAAALQKSATVIQRYARGTKNRRTFLRRKSCALRLQAFARMLRALLRYKRTVKDIVRVQVS